MYLSPTYNLSSILRSVPVTYLQHVNSSQRCICHVHASCHQLLTLYFHLPTVRSRVSVVYSCTTCQKFPAVNISPIDIHTTRHYLYSLFRPARLSIIRPCRQSHLEHQSLISLSGPYIYTVYILNLSHRHLRTAGHSRIFTSYLSIRLFHVVYLVQLQLQCPINQASALSCCVMVPNVTHVSQFSLTPSLPLSSLRLLKSYS